MKSPFPGMDPYLEARWSNVHTTLVAVIQEALQPQLPRALRARAEERVLLEVAGDVGPVYRSDVAVVDTGRADRPPAATKSRSAPIEAVVIEFQEQETVERWVQIIDTTNSNRVVTAIEVLSPGNKAPGRSNSAYVRKLEGYQRGEVSVVEIDLLRHPSRARLSVRSEDIPEHRRAPYLVCVRRGWEPHRWSAYPIPLRTQLPWIPVPLRRTDPDIGLDLQELVERAYAAGGHDDIDYGAPPDPPLAPEDAEWARPLIASPRGGG